MPWIIRIYGFLTWFMQPVLWLYLKKRARRDVRYGENMAARFGFYGKDVNWAIEKNTHRIWIHAASLGETRAITTFVAELRRRYPGALFLLTHNTPTGMGAGRSLVQGEDVQTWLPWDCAPCIDRFLATFQPTLGLLVETEVWPMLVMKCREKNMPLGLINARLSEKNHRQYQKFSLLSRPLFQGLAFVVAQSEEDGARLKTMGAKVVGVSGNLKYDVKPNQAQLVLGQLLKRSNPQAVVLLASSREGEEALFLDAVMALKKQSMAANNPMCLVQYLIVPRHPERFDETEKLCAQMGLSVSKKSTWSEGAKPSCADIWLGDTMGEMPFYYGLADACLLGGSFLPFGGQNLIEALACDCPVIMGPSLYNFLEAAQLAEKSGAAVRVGNFDEAMLQINGWIADDHQREIMRNAAKKFAHANQGAGLKTVELIKRQNPNQLD